MRLYLARHGESTGNAERLIFGQRDYPLTEKGRAQARALGRSLEGARIERVVASPLIRALETARLALEVLTKARRAEGRALESYLLNALDEIDTSHRAALARAPERVSEFRQALTERLSVLKESSVEVDSVRLATEVALLADRIDVTEELTRIATHLSALRFLIQQPSDPLVCLGKKIDFYLQELNREATTMASKSRDTILTRHTIDIRTTIESIREQAANIQ